MLPLLAAALLAPTMTSDSAAPHPTSTAPIAETRAQRDARMRWWREARFGMFVHWGLYSIAAGDWHGKPGGEWILSEARITRREYEPLARRWNPSAFDAKAWVGLAKEAGMRYLVVTSKHHEGFGLWPSRQGGWNVGGTPVRRDVLRELAKECRAQGIRLCFYHSIMDWHHPDYLPRREWDREGEVQADFDRYVAYMKAQLKELLTEYGEIGILWFDGEWEGTWTHERGEDLYRFVRALQPKLIVNNRVSKGRAGMQGMTRGEAAGDYGTPEQEIPPGGLPGVDWESCMTMNDTWGYRAADHDWKSATTLVRNLIDCASKGGNYLLNVGPTRAGAIPPESVARLREIGRWTRANGEAIYGTSAGPFPRPLPWGRATRKGDRIYLHVFADAERVVLPGFRAEVVGARALVGGKRVPTRAVEDGLELDLRGVARDPIATVVRLDVRGAVEVAPVVPRQSADGAIDLDAPSAEIRGSSARLQGDNVGYWTDPGDAVAWTFEARPGPVEVEIEYACEPGSEGSRFAVEIGGERLAGTVAATGGWNAFRRIALGRATLAAGRTDVAVRALAMPNGAVMNLRAIRLRAAK